MRKPVIEVKNVFDNQSYSTNNIICEVMKTFKLKARGHQGGFYKQAGYSTSEILMLMLRVPLPI